MTANVAASYVANNTVSAGELPSLIRSIHSALQGVDKPAAAPEAPLAPAVSIRKSISDDYLICLEDGRKFKSLKRHLRSAYNMTPNDYRAKWGLPKTYPMVAPGYAAARSALAKEMGLGQGGRGSPKSASSGKGRRGTAKAAESGA